MIDRRAARRSGTFRGGRSVLRVLDWRHLGLRLLSDLKPHILQLLFFGATTVVVASGIWITTRFLSTDRNRLTMTIGAVIAMAGLAVNVARGLWVWRSRGVVPPRPSAEVDRGCVGGWGSMWLVVLALGGRWGSEGDVSLTGIELGLAVGGLVLTTGGLTSSGVETLRRRNRRGAERNRFRELDRRAHDVQKVRNS